VEVVGPDGTAYFDISLAARRLGEVGRELSRLVEGASFGIGLATLRKGESLDEVIGRADRNLYENRGKAGREGMASGLEDDLRGEELLSPVVAQPEAGGASK
jgi:hypothetical protein